MNKFTEIESQLEQVNSAEELLEVLKKNGMDVTLEELKNAVEKELQASEELSEDSLDNVAGGVSLATLGLGLVARWVIKNGRRIKEMIAGPIRPRF